MKKRYSILSMITVIAVLLCNACSFTKGFMKDDTASHVIIDHTQLNPQKKDGKDAENETESPEESETTQVEENESSEYVFDGNADSMEELYQYVASELSKGNTKIAFTTDSLNLDEIKTINEYLDGFYGVVKSFSSQEGILNHKRTVVLEAELKDNYYVEQYILNGQSIPEDRTKAMEVAKICQEVRDQMYAELGNDPSDYKKELWYHNYLVSTVAYGFGDSEEDSHDTYGALIRKDAVCSGYANSMKLLCDISDVTCILVSGSGNGESHAWNMVQLDGEWYNVDVTWDDPAPDQKGMLVYTYLNVTDDRLGISHVWERERYPKATATAYNYYMKNDLFCKDYDDFKEKCISIMDGNDVKTFQVMVGDYDPDRYDSDHMEFLFDYTDYRNVNYKFVGEIPYETIAFTFE